MLRSVLSRGCAIARTAVKTPVKKQAPVLATTWKHYSSAPSSEITEMEKNIITMLDNPDTDGWEVRKLANDIQGSGEIPDPLVICSFMKACRRLNDYALAIRILEATKFKCGAQAKTFWPYIMSQVQPTLDELGILSLEDMGYDKPELYLEDVFDMH